LPGRIRRDSKKTSVVTGGVGGGTDTETDVPVGRKERPNGRRRAEAAPVQGSPDVAPKRGARSR
jgi:hypothetical protein